MSKIEVIPLGTVSPYCKDNKNCPGFLIKYKDNNIMFDCGNGTTRLMKLPNDLNNLKVFISHLHPDHYGDISSLAQAALVYKRLGMLEKNIDIFIPDGDRQNDYDYSKNEYIDRHIVDYEYIQNFLHKYPIEIHDINGESIEDDDLKISFLRVPHDLTTFAFRIDTPEGSVVYSGDTGTKNNLRKFAKECDLFICESTFLEGQYRKDDVHLYAKDAALIAKDADVKKLLLTHFWPEIDKDEYKKEAQKYFENTEVAEEGKKLIIKR